MVDIISEHLAGILFCIVLLETAILFANWVNCRASASQIIPMIENPESRFFGFTGGDFVSLVIDLVWVISVIWFFAFLVMPLYQSVQASMNEVGIERVLPYVSVTLAFVALSFSLFFQGINEISKLFAAATARGHANNLDCRLTQIEQILTRIEENRRE